MVSPSSSTRLTNMQRPPIEFWTNGSDIDSLPSSEYWNDRSKEIEKAFDVSDGAFSKLESYIEKKEVLRQFYQIAGLLEKPLAGKGASLGSGVCWLEGKILKSYIGIKNICCVEFSKHRICELAPLVLSHYAISPERVRLCLGSFYDLKIEDNEMDFVILVVSFHHAYEPMKLLKEVRRVLKPRGVVIIVGEHFFPWHNVLLRAVKHVIKIIINHKGCRGKESLLPRWETLFPSGGSKGDHHYSQKMYQRFFRESGFSYKRFVYRRSRLQSWKLQPKIDPL